MRALALVAAAFTLGVLALPAGAAEDGRIAFERRSGTGVGELFLVRADGTGLRKLGVGTTSFDPAWSPDGRRVVFSQGTGANELFVIDANGRNARRLTRAARGTTAWTADSQPAWSPDGKRIAFVRLAVRGSSSQSDLWVVNADGTGLRRLTRTRAEERAPAWNGPTLAFERNGGVYALVDGRARLLVRGGEPAFSPRGNGPFAFVRGGVVYATLGERVTRVAPGSAPTWAPDGSRLAYSTPAGLFTARPDGSDRRRLTRPPQLVHDLAPAWRP